MPQDIRVWQVRGGDRLNNIQRTVLNDEARIEKWLEEDISILTNDMLIIGRQVRTAYGGFIDLLGINQSGDLVILELKRDKTPRDITAQALDYASWVADLSHEDVTELADQYLRLKGKGSLEDAFRKKFETDLPDVLNENQEMLVVGSEIDSGSERIMKFLSEKHGVAINAATFQHFSTDDGKELLARVFLMAPTEVEYSTKAKGRSKRQAKLTYEQLCEIADEKGVLKLFGEAGAKLYPLFDSKGTTNSTQSFKRRVEGSQQTVFHLQPRESDGDKGLNFAFYVDRLAEHLGIDPKRLLSEFPLKVETAPSQILSGTTEAAGFMQDTQQLDSMVEALSRLKSEQAHA